MKHFTYVIFAFVFSLLIVSCNSTSENCEDWGKQVHYSDFWFKKYVPDTLYKTLNIDADSEIAQNVELQLYKKVEGGLEVKVPTSEVQLFADGVICPNNVICIRPSTKSVRVGLVFAQEAHKGNYQWSLKVKNRGDVEVLNGYDLTGDTKEIFEWRARKQVVWNPIVRNATILGVVLVILVIVWFILIRFLLFDYFKVAKVNLGTSEKLYSKKVKGLLSLTFTAKRQQQSILERWFVGERMYVVDAFFEAGDIVIIPKNKKSVGIRGVQNYDATSTTVCVNDDPVVIKNPAKQKCEITIV